jgi:hypothetical protein
MAKSRQCLESWISRDRGYQKTDRMYREFDDFNAWKHAIPPLPPKRRGFLARFL